jgi:DNA-binding CsgD family transcriptional regulator
MAGGTRVPVTLRPPGFRPDLDELARAITPRTRLILLNSPHNPTGSVFTRDELAALADLAVRHDLLVVTDEVYEHLAFDGEHVPIAGFPGMRERTVRISSAGKTFSFTGWKIGWVLATPELVTAVRTAKQFLTFVSGGPFQYAIAQALALPDSYYTTLRADLQAQRDLLTRGLADLGFEVYPSQGTYFVLTDIASLGERDGLEFCRTLPERAGVVAIPSSVFYDHADAARTQVRFAFCKRPEVLSQALARLKNLLYGTERGTCPPATAGVGPWRRSPAGATIKGMNVIARAGPRLGPAPGSPGPAVRPAHHPELLGRHSGTEPLTRLTPREREVLALMAEGRSNAAIAQRLCVTEKAVSKHAAGIFAKLNLAPSDDDNRRVPAVLAYLES